jgi:hypothetical protein
LRRLLQCPSSAACAELKGEVGSGVPCREELVQGKKYHESSSN